MKVVIPPLKSQGIKTKLVPWIMELKGELTGRWIEPFLGTGVVTFNSKAKEALLSDINPYIIKFYTELQIGTITPEMVRNYLIAEGHQLSISGDKHYKFIRSRFNVAPNSLDFLFLSRAGFNGMMRFSKKGHWNLPFCKKPNRFSPSYITKIVNQIKVCQALIKPNWEFRNSDFRVIIPLAQKNDLIYCDPPYAGRYADYYSGWSEADEYDLFALLSKTTAKFILSAWHHNKFRVNANIAKYWHPFNLITKNHFYHNGAKAENRNPMVETLIFNFDVDQMPLGLP